MIKILLRWAHGLGDVVQASVVLKHLAKYRPDWEIHFRCGRGKHTAVQGLCAKVWHDQESDPEHTIGYRAVNEPGFCENQSRCATEPNTKAVACLREVFGIAYDPSLGQYQVMVRESVFEKTARYLVSLGCKETRTIDAEDADLTIGTPYPSAWCKFNCVVIHYEGNTSPERKNLRHWQASAICEQIIRAGRVPIVLDWDHRSPLPDNVRIFCPAVGHGDIWGNTGTGDAETIAALIEQSEAFIGIDSGPGKIASATNTPSLIVWTGHHPLQFHDPAPNTTHLVPEHHRSMAPIDNDDAMAEYFERTYLSRTYADGPHALTLNVNRWLGEVLGCEEDIPTVQYVLPTGIGDVVWALHKIRSVAREEHNNAPIDIILSGNPANVIDRRTIPFLARFHFVRSACVMDVPVIRDQSNPTDERGRYRYEPDGMREYHHCLCPNATLERGERLETWLPEYPTDWDVVEEFDWSGTDRGTAAGKDLGKFVAFYLGPESGNTDEGHNRGGMWRPQDWVKLAAWFVSQGCRIALVGAAYDMSYWDRHVKPEVSGIAGEEWANMIATFEIGETFAFLKESRCLIAYQCGLGICHSLFGGNVLTWWRPDQNSIHPHRMVAFDERMRNAWVNPALANNYLGLIYGRESVSDICELIEQKGWVR